MRVEILKLLGDGGFVSGEYIAKHLGVSRTAVWKQIKSLQNLGYEIESVKNKGYRLVSRPDIPIVEEVTLELDTQVIGKDIYYFKSLASTNLFAKKLVKDGVEEGAIVVSDVQSGGRGRKSRNWFSPEGGLWFSIVLYPHIPPERGMLITMAGSIAVVQGIKETTDICPVIKWPNDLLINGKKVCGILTELDAEMDCINYTVVGIGINVNNRLSEDLQGKATSLIQEAGSKVSRVKLLRSILKCFDENYSKLISGDYDFIRDSWFSHANIVGREILVHGEKTMLRGVVSDVDESGCLILDTKNGSVRVVSGDVEYL
ncbi:MAG: biotin--[acetyl-CoA-carboxylase] ligase [Thermoplasmatales archaeon]|nr:biotin--[acetyl-CoA-carboxylase] ligase [Thermoplasmatales archaeon]